MTGNLHEDQYTFVIISLSVLLNMRYISDKRRGENRKMFYDKQPFFFFFFFANRAVWDNAENIVQSDKVQMTVWWVCIARWIPKATHTHSQCVILVAFRLQQWVHKGLYVHCLSSLTETESQCCACCSVQAVKFGLQRPYFAWGSYSLASHGGRLDSIPGHSVWHLSSTKGYKDNFFSEDFGPAPRLPLPAPSVTHPHLHVAHTRRTNEWNLWFFQKSMLLRKPGELDRSIFTCCLVFKGLLLSLTTLESHRDIPFGLMNQSLQLAITFYLMCDCLCKWPVTVINLSDFGYKAAE